MYFGIATFPAKEVQDFANSYRKRYDPHYTLIPPHITLKERFELEQEKVNQLTQELERIAKNFRCLYDRPHKSEAFPSNESDFVSSDRRRIFFSHRVT